MTTPRTTTTATTTSSIAIIGTRDPSPEQVALASWAAITLSGSDYRWWVVTGGAYGIDQVAMDGAFEDRLQVKLPWSTYNREIIPAHAQVEVLGTGLPYQAWYDSVDQYHPAPGRLTQSMRRLHARNYGIVASRTAVLALPGPGGAGGTGQGIRIAKGLSLPLFQYNKGDRLPSFDELYVKIRSLVDV